MALEKRYCTTEQEAMREYQVFVPDNVPAQRIVGAKEMAIAGLGFHRGHQAGVFSAVLTIRDRYPEVARELREAFSMDEDGSVRVGG